MSHSFYVLGSSSGLPSADKATSGYLLKTGESLTLIDCGGGVTQSFLKRGFNPLNVDRIVISHTHSDHVCELTLFIQLIYLHKRKNPLDLYLPADFITPFKNYLQAVYLIEEKMPFQINFHPLTDQYIIQNDLFGIQVILNDHLNGYNELIEKLDLPNKMLCFSPMIKTNNKSLLYTSDLATLNPITKYLKDLDILLIETTHIDINDLIPAVERQNIGQIVATHLGTKEEINAYIQAAHQAGLTNMIVALDGMEIIL